jgi:hypothetical protein
MTSIQDVHEKRIHLDVNPKKVFYTSGDRVIGIVQYDPVWGTDIATKVDIFMWSRRSWFSDYDDSKSNPQS